jgi:NDP-sugar pyrophosphorylase family protein
VSSEQSGRGSAVILAGGRGTRLGAITDTVPKPMLPIDGHPFIEYLVWQLQGFGVGTIVISSGYRGEAIRSYFGSGERWGTEIRYSVEESPLGTGGGLRLAAQLVEDERFLLLNGDSVCEVDCRALLEAISDDVPAAMALTRVADGSRYGSVDLNAEGRVMAFLQNDPTARPALVNAGVYALTRQVVDLIPSAGPSSLERDVMPSLLGRIQGIVSNGFFVDIGLPETYRQLNDDPEPLLRAVRRPDYFG